jgi:hypothetical protein
VTTDDEGTAHPAAGYHACLGNLADLPDGASISPLIDAEAGPHEDHYRRVISAERSTNGS